MRGFEKGIYVLSYIGILLGLGICVGIFLYRAYYVCMFPYPVEAGEGICLHMTNLLKQGNLYKGLDSFPLIIANYPPVYFLINYILNGIFHQEHSFLIGRVISTISILGMLGMIYAISFRFFRSIYISLWCVLLLLVLPWINLTGSIYRVDFLGAFFSLCGMYFSLSERKEWQYVGVVFFLLSLYTKHSFVAAPIATYCFLLFSRGKESLWLSGWLFGSGILIMLVLTSLTHGEFFNHLVRYNVYGFETARLFWHMKQFFLSTLFVLLCSILIILTKDFKKGGFIIVYGICALATLLMTGREGASRLYFLEAGFAIVLSAGYGIYCVTKRYGKIWAGVLCIVVLGGHTYVNREVFTRIKIPKERYIAGRRILKRIQNTSGPILAEDPGIGYLMLAGKQVYVHPFPISKMIKLRLLEPQLLYSHIEGKFFDMVILNSRLDNLKFCTLDRFTKESLYLVYQNYRFDKEILGYFFYYRNKR